MTSEFSKEILREWEQEDGVNFAIALSRITGWILQVEWMAKSQDERDYGGLIPLRVNVADNRDLIFDFTGVYSIESYYNEIILPLADQRNTFSEGGCACRFYEESKLFNLPLRQMPEKSKIENAIIHIQKNTSYLSKIPLRKDPKVPANQAATFTFGKCNPFSEAIYQTKNIPPVALIAKKYTSLFGHSKLGYVHSFNQIDKETGLDVWGIDSIENISKRFGISDYDLSTSVHQDINKNFKQNSPEAYEHYYQESLLLIEKYFNEIGD